MMRADFEVKVEQRHIEDGVSTPSKCPIALAVREACPEVTDVAVALGFYETVSLSIRAVITDPTGKVEEYTQQYSSSDAFPWVRAFDHGKVVKPHTFGFMDITYPIREVTE